MSTTPPRPGGGRRGAYRRLAEQALERLLPYLPEAGPQWTAGSVLPGGQARWRLDRVAGRRSDGMSWRPHRRRPALDRIADLAIEYREDAQPLPPEAVERIARLIQDAGANAKISSIHVNGWSPTGPSASAMTRRHHLSSGRSYAISTSTC